MKELVRSGEILDAVDRAVGGWEYRRRALARPRPATAWLGSAENRRPPGVGSAFGSMAAALDSPAPDDMIS